jgi:hypothetical protein
MSHVSVRCEQPGVLDACDQHVSRQRDNDNYQRKPWGSLCRTMKICLVCSMHVSRQRDWVDDVVNDACSDSLQLELLEEGQRVKPVLCVRL